MKEIYLAGYDFWKYQKYFSYMDGVAVVEVGYMENKSSITKEAVNQDGGLVEVLHLIYDSDLISLDQILDLFFYQVDPMSKKKEISLHSAIIIGICAVILEIFLLIFVFPWWC